MSRTNAMRRLRRVLQIALHSNAKGITADDAKSEPARADSETLERRRVLTAAAAAGVAAALPAPGLLRQALAAPSTQGGVAIVGAGLAGLSCAYQLAAKGMRATLYDAGTRVGGRCWSLRDVFPGQVAERGGELIDTTHTTMRGYANAFGLALEDLSKVPGDTAYYIDGRHYSEAQVVDEFRAFVPSMQDDLRRIGRPTADRHTSAEVELDNTTLADYLTSRGAGTLIQQVIDAAYTIEYGLEISQQSCLAFLLFIHADRRSKFATFGVFSDERFHVVNGNDLIVRGLADALPGQIELGQRLVAARKLSDGRIRLTFDGGARLWQIDYDAVVLATPFSTLREVQLDVSLELPDWKRYAIANLAYGTNAKLMVGFDGRPWFALHASNGSSYADLTSLQNTWETNPARATASSAILTDFTGGKLGASLDPLKAQQATADFLADLDKVYPGASGYATRVRGGQYRVHLENWSRNPLFKGSYTANQPGYFTTIADNEAKPVGNLFFAGEHTSSFYEWQGFMEGGALSGLRAAGEVYDYLRGK